MAQTFQYIPIMHKLVNTSISLTRSVNMYYIARSAKKLELYLAGNYFILAVANN